MHPVNNRIEKHSGATFNPTVRIIEINCYMVIKPNQEVRCMELVRSSRL